MSITLVVGEDWVGIYVDGELLDEGRRIDVTKPLHKLGHSVDTINIDPVWLEEHGLPQNLDDIPKNAIK